MSATASSTPISTYMTYLLYSEKGKNSYKKLVDITETPDKGGAPEMIDVTTLSDKMKKSIPGIQSTAELKYPANYVPSEYAALKALEGQELDFVEALGGEFDDEGNLISAGHEGANYFSGKMSVYMKGGGVNAVHGIEITIANTTTIEPKIGSITLATT